MLQDIKKNNPLLTNSYHKIFVQSVVDIFDQYTQKITPYTCIKILITLSIHNFFLSYWGKSHHMHFSALTNSFLLVALKDHEVCFPHTHNHNN